MTAMTIDSTLTLLACQIEVPPTPDAATRDAHLAQSAQKVDEALRNQRVDLVVLPELSSIDYSRAAFNRLDLLAEPLDGPSFQCWRAVARAHGCHIAYGFARREGANYYVTIAVVDPEGALVGYYDKIHLAQYGASMEKEYFARGSRIFTFEVNGFRIAPIICYDIRIPELSRTLTIDHGVDLILHCGAYFRDRTFATWHSFATARAIENQIFYLSLNRAGGNFGESLFCWPWMDENTPPERFAAHDEEFRRIELDHNVLLAARENFSFLQDRLPSYALSGT